MAIISLITDFGYKDEYVGLMKAVILKINPKVKIIDLNHEIPPQDVVWANYLLESSYKFFPKGTIFLCVVDPEVGTKRKIVIVKTKNYIFVSPDNGILTRVLEKEKPVEIIEARNKKFFLPEISPTFHGRDIMASVSAHLSKGIKLSQFGPPLKEIKKIPLLSPLIKDKSIIGKIIHIDHFGNLVTNIEKDLFNCIVKKKRFFIEIKNEKIFKINSFYAESKKGEILAIWGSRNLLEISVNLGDAAKELGVEKNEEVRVNFFD